MASAPSTSPLTTSGAGLGYDRLPQRWIEPLHDTVKTLVAGFGQGSISGLAERTIALRTRLFRG